MTEGHALDALNGLLEERRRYEGWLAQLEARRGTSPSHVVDRVRHDYLDRLRGVTETLRGRAAELEASAADLAARIAALLAEETQRRDERAETELRAMVGEYSDDQAQGALAGFDRTIADLVDRRAALGSELARVQEVLASVNPPAPPPPAAPSPAPAPAAHQPPQTAAAPAAGFDELAFLQSVVKPRDHAPHAEAPQADYLPPPALATVRRTGGSNEEAVADQLAPGASSAATPDVVTAYFKDVPTEQVKTLKCAECGTMNYPTEWYCERCGGELAAM